MPEIEKSPKDGLEAVIAAEREIFKELMLEAWRVFTKASKYVPIQALPKAYQDQALANNAGNYAVG